jgi:hypothetical protein
MKILIDAIGGPPPHALTRRDIKAVLAALPKVWDFPLPIVHLKATLPTHIDYDRPIVYDFLGGPRLNVYSRGMFRQDAITGIVRELAIQGLHRTTRRGRRLSHAELDEIDKKIQPILAQVENALADKTPPARVTLKHFDVYRALEANGFTWKEAYQVVLAMEEDLRNPTSRNKANRINRAKQALRDAGIDPETMTAAVS